MNDSYVFHSLLLYNLLLTSCCFMPRAYAYLSVPMLYSTFFPIYSVSHFSVILFLMHIIKFRLIHFSINKLPNIAQWISIKFTIYACRKKVGSKRKRMKIRIIHWIENLNENSTCISFRFRKICLCVSTWKLQNNVQWKNRAYRFKEDERLWK